jgi:putative inorganic carbon (hco3(-)) transporter
MIHFGLSGLVPLALYLAGVVAFFLSIFWRPIVGIYYLVPLIPLQTARYYLIAYPFGQSVVDIILAGVIIGLMVRQRTVFLSTPWNTILTIYCTYTFISLCLGSFYLNKPLPLLPGDPRLADWKNYMVMPLLLFVVAAAVTEKREIRILILLMLASVVMLDRGFWDTVSGRDFSSFSYDLRDEGGMGYAGVNGFAAFEAQAAAFLVALTLFEKRWLWRIGYLALAGFTVACLMYSLSRGGYLAFLLGCLFLGLVKDRKLLVLLGVFLVTWTSVVPVAVRERVMMTYDQNSKELDHSAQMRVNLWEEAKAMFESNVVTGTGFYTYAYTNHINGYKDTHNLYVKVLVETGIVGFLLFLWLLAKTFATGFRLFRLAEDPFLRSLGLGLAVWVVCVVGANLFGDRWTFLQVNGFMWVLGGLVFRGLCIETEAAELKEKVEAAGDTGLDVTPAHEPLPAVS